MRASLRVIRATTPEIKPARAGWLAVSEAGSALRIGVLAPSEDEAKARFRDELAAWVRLLEAAEEDRRD